MTRMAEYIAEKLQASQEVANADIKTLITPVYNIVGYGAVGDGVTDDTAAVQAAIDAANAAGATGIFWPQGSYYVGTLTDYSGLNFYSFDSVTFTNTSYAVSSFPAYILTKTSGAERTTLGQPPQGNSLDATNFEITAGSSSVGYSSQAPVIRAQANVSITDNTASYPAAFVFQSRINPDNNNYYSNAWFTLQDNAVGLNDHVCVTSYASATVDRDAGATGSDLWAYWGIVNNGGKNANALAMELNCTNLYANWLDTAPNGVPASHMYGLQIIPADSTKHCTRAISIAGYNSNTYGWDTGINLVGFVSKGIYINSQVPYQDPPTNSVVAPKIGIYFGKDLLNLIQFETDAETRRLAFSRSGSGDTSEWSFLNPLNDEKMLKFSVSDNSIKLGNNVFVVTQTEAGLMLEGLFRAITAGANDSAGTGYRVLRVPNA